MFFTLWSTTTSTRRCQNTFQPTETSWCHVLNCCCFWCFKSPLVSIEKGIKFSSSVYWKIFEKDLLLGSSDTFGSRCLTQDRSLAHSGSLTEHWYKRHFLWISWEAMLTSIKPCIMWYLTWAIFNERCFMYLTHKCIRCERISYDVVVRF